MTNYILSYYQKITDGTITAGVYIKKWYEQIVHKIEKKEYTYNAKKAAAAVVFVENFCRHSEGALGGQKFRLELWQKALLSVIFGIVNADGARQFTEVLIIVARKNGKTLFAAAIAAYCAYMDGEYGARIYFAAPKLEQASLCFNAFQQIIYTEPMLDKMTKKRRTDIYIEQTNTTAKPLAFSEKKSDGLNISLCVADEIAAWQGDSGLKFYEVIKSSFGARRQPLLLSISTAGYISDGVYDELIKRGTRVIKGDSKETRLAPFLYIIDDATKWNDINELQKSNPNLGVSVTVDYLLDEIAVAEGSIPKKAEFLTKYCNVKQNSACAWLDTETIRKASGPVLSLDDFRGCYCVVGVDLSRTTDLTAATCIIEKGGALYVFAKFFLPRDKIDEASARDGLPYRVYEQRGLLVGSGENFVDYHDVFQWIAELMQTHEIYPLFIGYDRYSAQYLVQDLSAAGFRCDDVYQGENLTPVINEVEGLLKDGRVHVGDNDLLKIHLINTALKINAETERKKIIKISAQNHIDGTAALLDAFCVRQKYADEIGAQLKNEE